MKDKKKAEIPIIALTANVTNKDRKAVFDEGMNAFAEKPIFVDQLFFVMNGFLCKP